MDAIKTDPPPAHQPPAPGWAQFTLPEPGAGQALAGVVYSSSEQALYPGPDRERQEQRTERPRHANPEPFGE